MATSSPLFIDAGSNYVNIISAVDTINQPLILTGYTVKSQIRKSPTSTTFYNFTATIYNDTLGQIKLELTAVQTAAIASGRWLYDVEITSPSSIKTRVIEGIVTITPQITQT